LRIIGQGRRMHGVIDRRNAGWRRARLSLGLAVGLLASPLAPAVADEAPAYGSRAKATIMQLVAGREFKAESGCDRSEPCASLLARLRTGDFAVVEPAERSDRPDMPSYLKARKRCPKLDLARVVAAHRTFTATRSFAIYRLDLPRPAKGSDEVLIFRAQHYVMLEGKGPAAEDGDESVAFWPGNFVAFGVPSCRFLSIALAEDGDRFAKHNALDDTDYASELLKLGDRYFVVNLDPIAGPHQAKETWWYALQLWDLGTHADADRRKQRHVYSFGYKPTATSLGDGAAPFGLDRGQALAPRG
jgi:hypothetical protein